MTDSVTIERIPQIHPKLRTELYTIYNEICCVLEGIVGCRFTQVFRTFAEQDAFYAQGRTTPGDIVTNAKGGQSYHNYGLAVDFVLILDKNGDGRIEEISWDRLKDYDRDKVADWMEVVNVFTKYGWQWGASFGDYPHFEKRFNYNWRTLLELRNAGKVDSQGYVLI